MVTEAQSPITELLAKNLVLLAWIVNDPELALIHPPGNGAQQKAQWVENSLGLQSPLSRVWGNGGTRSSFGTIRDRSPSGVLTSILELATPDGTTAVMRNRCQTQRTGTQAHVPH